MSPGARFRLATGRHLGGLSRDVGGLLIRVPALAGLELYLDPQALSLHPAPPIGRHAAILDHRLNDLRRDLLRVLVYLLNLSGGLLGPPLHSLGLISERLTLEPSPLVRARFRPGALTSKRRAN